MLHVRRRVWLTSSLKYCQSVSNVEPLVVVSITRIDVFGDCGQTVVGLWSYLWSGSITVEVVLLLGI